MKGRAKNREGMALLTVLLLVAVMAAVAAAVLDDVRFSIRRTTNVERQAQAQWYAAGAEKLARREILRLAAIDPARTPVQPAWNGRRLDFPVEGGVIGATITDGQACFNLNSVVQGVGEDLTVRPEGVTQLLGLGRAVGVAESRMRAVADALVDWMDADAEPRPLGAEDGAYAGLSDPYRTAGVLLVETSELRAVKGVDPELYRQLRPWVCALPTSRPAALNINTLTPEQAPLLVMLSDGALGVAEARRLIERRPAGGWRDVAALRADPAAAALPPTADEQLTVLTRWFDLRVDVDYGGARAVRTALLHAPAGGAVRTVMQRWTPDE